MGKLSFRPNPRDTEVRLGCNIVGIFSQILYYSDRIRGGKRGASGLSGHPERVMPTVWTVGVC